MKKSTLVVRSKVVMCCIILLAGLLFVGATSISESYHKKMELEVSQKKQWGRVVASSFEDNSHQNMDEWTAFAQENPELMLKASTDYFMQQ